MRKIAISLVLGLMLCPLAQAQLNVDAGDGNTVSIGPDGIHVNSNAGGTHLNITPGGISGVAGGATQLNIGAGRGTVGNVVKKTEKTLSKISRTSSSSSTQSTSTASLQERVAQLEIAVSGKAVGGQPLLARVEKLEDDNLGKKGTGSLADRVKTLELAIGVGKKSSAASSAQSSFSTSGQAAAHGNSLSVTTRSNGNTASTQVTTQVDGSGSGTASQISVGGNDQHLTYNLNGGGVIVDGSRCHVKINGNCDSLIVNGDYNHIDADSIGNIIVNGNGNKTTWLQRSNPRLIDNGNGNQSGAR